MTYSAFQTQIAQINDILCTVNLLSWDARTVMPHGGVDTRGHQIATLTSLARDMATSDTLRATIEAARQGATLSQTRALDQATGEVALLTCIPAALIGELAQLKTAAHATWAEARAQNDFANYAPLLTRMIAMQREIGQALGQNPYDALIGLYEPGMTQTRLATLFGDLKTALVPLIEQATSAPQPRTDFLTRAFPIPAQKAFGLKIAAKMGYDLNRGRLDDTIHPFEISFTRGDVRITSRFRETWLPGGMFALWHEAGHGMYEQGLSPEYTRSIFATDLANLYAVGGASFGIHESQSRLWENRIGRSRAFWDLHFPDLQAHFPGLLDDVTAGEFWAAVNQVRPDFIRVEADELTYDLHIILRAEIESALMMGDLQVADLPGVWAEKMRAYLGREVPNDTLGVLQDVHWSQGYVGSFPTYTLGNIMSSQFFAAAKAQAGIAGGLMTGDYAPLHRWLAENIYAHGRAQTPAETLMRLTGSPLQTGPYIADLTAKVADLTRV